jgi:hypothetical protein
MDVLTGKLQLIVVGELGYFLDHFFELLFRGGAYKAGSLDLEKIIFDYKFTEVKVRALFEQHFEVEGGREVAYLGAEDDLLAAGYAALLGKGQYRLEAVGVDRHHNDSLGMVIVGELPTGLIGVLFEGSK